MVKSKKTKKLPISELEAMFKQFQALAKREKLTRAKVIKEIKKDRAERGKSRRTPKGESALEILTRLADVFPEGLGPFERDKSERDFEKYFRNSNPSKEKAQAKRITLKQIPLGDEEGEYTPEFRRSLLEARRERLSEMEDQEDIARADKIMGKASRGKGKFYSHADVLKKLKLKRGKKRK